MERSDRKISQITGQNPNAMTYGEISGNDRKKALELLKQCKERELIKNQQKQKEDESIEGVSAD